MKAALFILLSVAYCVSGLAISNKNRVAGGSLARLGEFPYVVSLTENDRHFCGGFIYSEQWILTAASCVAGKNANAIKVVSGSVSAIEQEPNQQTSTVFSIHIINLYNSTFKQNDIALLKLSAALDLTSTDVDFIRYNEVMDTTVDATATVMGWGATMAGGLESINLRSAIVDIEDITPGTACGDFAAEEFATGTMVCAKGTATTPTDPAKPGSPCQYDEGSPLVQGSVAVGIISKTSGCSATSYAIYTRISVYYSWLMNTAGVQPA